MEHVQCCTAQNGVGAFYSLHCWTCENPKEFSNFFASCEQMKINRNSQILFFSSGKQMDPRGSPDLAEALSTHQGLKAVIDLSVILADAVCMNCVRDVFKGLQITQRVYSYKRAKHIHTNSVS